MNRTLVELVQAMSIAQNVPSNLWPEATKHAAYLRNWTHTWALDASLPLEAWCGERPNVSHLHEFGAPVWVLVEGQNISKLDPKSERHTFVGFEDGPKAMRYFNKHTHQVCVSRNFQFTKEETKTHPLDNSHEPLTPNVLSEGELSQIAPPIVMNEEDRQNDKGADLKRKQTEEITPDTPRWSKQPRTAQDYQLLDDLWVDDPEMAGWDDENMTSTDRVYATFCETQIAPDNPKTLTEARRSPEWPQWEKAIQAELDQLHKMGTWELVDPPKGRVPVGNKWVLTKKYDKQGNLQKFKARLVAKGYTQMPGMDYTDTYAPVVRLETIRTLLALAISENWEIQQMDVKGAYLNGRIKEEIYMKQPDGYDDGTDRLC